MSSLSLNVIPRKSITVRVRYGSLFTFVTSYTEDLRVSALLIMSGVGEPSMVRAIQGLARPMGKVA